LLTLTDDRRAHPQNALPFAGDHPSKYVVAVRIALVDGEATSACLVTLSIALALEIRAGGVASTLADHRRFPGLD
jgi:hypothetical protein